MDPETILSEAEAKMSKAVDHALHEFSTLHTGKASPSMLDSVNVTVQSYGGTTSAIRDLAAVTTPDPRTIQIQAWDRTVAGDIKKAIEQANLGYNPQLEGGTIRINIPELSGDRRKELVRRSHDMAEEGRIGVRQARREAMDALKGLKKSSGLSEDDEKRYEKMVQELTDKNIEEIGKHLEHKEKELMTI